MKTEDGRGKGTKCGGWTEGDRVPTKMIMLRWKGEHGYERQYRDRVSRTRLGKLGEKSTFITTLRFSTWTKKTHYFSGKTIQSRVYVLSFPGSGSSATRCTDHCSHGSEWQRENTKDKHPLLSSEGSSHVNGQRGLERSHVEHVTSRNREVAEGQWANKHPGSESQGTIKWKTTATPTWTTGRNRRQSC